MQVPYVGLPLTCCSLFPCCVRQLYTWLCLIFGFWFGTADRATLVFHLGYHFHIRFQMLCFATPRSALHVIEDAMLHSASAVDSIASRLDIMTPGSPARVAWDGSKATALAYVRGRGSQGDAARHEIDRSLNGVSHQFRIELTFRVSTSIVHLVSYHQNVQAVVGNTMRGGMLSREGIGIFLSTVMDLRRECFSNEYMQTFDAVHHLMMLAVERQLTEMEVEKIHVTSLWQADNMVTHFRPRCFASDVDMRSALEQAGLGSDIFTSLRAMGLEDFASLLDTPTAATPSNPRVAVADSVNEDNGDEKEKEDESEKEDRPEKECVDEVSSKAMLTRTGVDEGSSGVQMGHFNIDWLEDRLSGARDSTSVHSVLSEISTMKKELEDKLQSLNEELDGLVAACTSDVPELVATSLNDAIEEKQDAVRSASVCIDSLNRLKAAALEKVSSLCVNRLCMNGFSSELLHRCLSFMLDQPGLETRALSQMIRSVVEMMPMDMLVTVGGALNLEQRLLEGDRGTLACNIKMREI